MSGYFQAAAGAMVTVIAVFCLGKEGKHTAMILVLGVCAMILMVMLSYLEPVIAFIHRLCDAGNLDQELISQILKAVGIALIGEIASLICIDSGNASLGKAIHLLSAAVILRISLPLVHKMLYLLEGILGEV